MFYVTNSYRSKKSLVNWQNCRQSKSFNAPEPSISSISSTQSILGHIVIHISKRPFISLACQPIKVVKVTKSPVAIGKNSLVCTIAMALREMNKPDSRHKHSGMTKYGLTK